MDHPTDGSVLWLTHTGLATASLHFDPMCSGLEGSHHKARNQGHEDPTALLNRFDYADHQIHRWHRGFCRMCALEQATLTAFDEVVDDPDRVPLSVAAIPSFDRHGSVRPRSESADERMRRIAEALGYPYVVDIVVGVIMYGDMPVTARPFLEANFYVSAPPADVTLDAATVSGAWTFFPTERTVPTDDWWRTAAAL